MKFPRLTISNLAVLVAVVAVDLAVARALIFADCAFELYAGGLTVPISQIAFYRLIRSRGLVRVFWVGFISGGLVALFSLLATDYRRYSTKTLPLARDNEYAWILYSDTALGFIRSLPFNVPTGPFPDDGILSNLVPIGICFLPQLVLALSTGLLFRQLARLLAVCQETGDGATHVPGPVDQGTLISSSLPPGDGPQKTGQEP